MAKTSAPAEAFASGSPGRAELDAIAKQVDQARSILADAVDRLNQGFGALDEEARKQRRLLERLLTSLSKDGQPADDNQLSVDAFTAETAQVLQQFTELLAHVSKESVKTVYRIDDMTKELDQIFALIGNVNDIARETFILSVNAGIEAANAGARGQSFRVIAANVRDLSRRTRTFNEKIADQVVRTRERVNEVRKTMSDMASRDLNLTLSGKERVQKMLTQLAAFQQFLADNVAEAEGTAERIESATSSSITALQFEDILTQLLGTVRKRIENLMSGNTSGSLPDPEVRDVVRQQSMAAGDVELF